MISGLTATVTGMAEAWKRDLGAQIIITSAYTRQPLRNLFGAKAQPFTKRRATPWKRKERGTSRNSGPTAQRVPCPRNGWPVGPDETTYCAISFRAAPFAGRTDAPSGHTEPERSRPVASHDAAGTQYFVLCAVYFVLRTPCSMLPPIAGGDKSAKNFRRGPFSCSAARRAGIPKPFPFKGLRQPFAAGGQNWAREM